MASVPGLETVPTNLGHIGQEVWLRLSEGLHDFTISE